MQHVGLHLFYTKRRTLNQHYTEQAYIMHLHPSIHPVVCYRQTPGYHVYVLMSSEPPSSLMQPKQSDLSVTSTLQSVNR